MDSGTSLEYLHKHLPKLRERFEWAPNLYGAELAHIDAISALVAWADSDNRSDAGLTDVLDQFAQIHGWSTTVQSDRDAHG